MPKLARLPANDRAPDDQGAVERRIPRFRHRYFAFLSYSHKDKEVADWLHDELEEYIVPHGLAGRLTQNGVIPKRLRPIFRDRHELAAADDLGEEIVAALASSQYLIVLCSPDAAKSQWTNAEIEMFKRTRPDGCVLAAIARANRSQATFRGARTRNASHRHCARNTTVAGVRRASAPSRLPRTCVKAAMAGGWVSSGWSRGCSGSASTTSSSATRPAATGGSRGSQRRRSWA
jgi:hypothetical protein